MTPATIRMDAAVETGCQETTSERFSGVSFKGFKRPPIKTCRHRVVAERHAATTGPGRQPLETSTEDEFSPEAIFSRDVLVLHGLDPAHYRIGPLVRRIPACLRALKTGTMDSAREILAKHPERLELAVNALLIGTTAFFRDAAVFEEIEKRVVPDILSRTARPRVWSVACSEGAELYSVAMLFTPRLLPDHGDFLGTDCRESALIAARAGTYQTRCLEGIPPGITGKHFSTSGPEITRVRRDLVSRMQWLKGDITLDPAEPGWDMILCRNLAIYLESSAMAALWEKLARALKPGGYLVTGRAEKPVVPGLLRVGPCIYRKTT